MPNPEEQIVKIVAITNTDQCIKWYEKLKIFVGRYQKIILTNQRKSERYSESSNSQHRRLRLTTKAKWPCGAKTEEDALEFYQ